MDTQDQRDLKAQKAMKDQKDQKVQKDPQDHRDLNMSPHLHLEIPMTMLIQLTWEIMLIYSMTMSE